MRGFAVMFALGRVVVEAYTQKDGALRVLPKACWLLGGISLFLSAFTVLLALSRGADVGPALAIVSGLAAYGGLLTFLGFPIDRNEHKGAVIAAAVLVTLPVLVLAYLGPQTLIFTGLVVAIFWKAIYEVFHLEQLYQQRAQDSEQPGAHPLRAKAPDRALPPANRILYEEPGE